jgi:PPK2 family polyphosphate:nucleotide phosphotransferase
VKLEPVEGKVRLRDSDARVDTKTGEALQRATKKEAERLEKLQHLLYADGRYALLIVLQGRDAAGKDGTIRKVFDSMDPQGCTVTAFGPPTPLERRHDFLWRVHQCAPPYGMVGIFNRSHYEEVLVPRVSGKIDKKECRRRYDQINDFERMLSAQGTVILKFMLHVSRAEQKRRLEERLSDPTKNWKFQAGDLDDRKRWPEFTKAYRDALESTSTKWAPWYVVPADDKPVRNWLVARTIADALEDLDLRYPPADPAVLALSVP